MNEKNDTSDSGVSEGVRRVRTHPPPPPSPPPFKC